MPQPEIVDETRGPGRPLSTTETLSRALTEIWVTLGHEDGHTPTLDEVLIEIRGLKSLEQSAQWGTNADTTPPMPANEYVEPDIRSVTYGAFGMTATGYSADDVLKLREAYAVEQQAARDVLMGR